MILWIMASADKRKKNDTATLIGINIIINAKITLKTRP